jgi:hypothetical protein
MFLDVANRVHVFLQVQEFIPDFLALRIDKGRILYSKNTDNMVPLLFSFVLIVTLFIAILLPSF